MEKPRPAPAQPQSVAISPSESNRPPARTDADPAAAPVVRGRGADCAHCLRPLFTARLSRDLDRGAAINLVAKPGQGAGRLLEDIKGLPANGPRLVSNLKKHRRIQTGLVADLWHQSGLDGESPADFGALCLRLEKDAPSTALLLHRFDSARLAELMEQDPPAESPESDELDVLAVLIEDFETKHFPIDPPDPVDAIEFRMDQMGLTRKDLVPYIGSQSKVSEVLNRKRPLSLSMIRRLSEGLGISADVLIREPAQVRLRDGVDGELPLPQRLKRWRHRLDWERWWPSVRMLTQLRDRAAIGWRALGLPPPGEVLKSLKDLLPWLGGKMG